MYLVRCIKVLVKNYFNNDGLKIKQYTICSLDKIKTVSHASNDRDKEKNVIIVIRIITTDHRKAMHFISWKGPL